MAEYASFTYKSFTGGMRDRDHASEILDNQYAYGKNLSVRAGGLFENRDGRTKRVNSPGSLPQGACWFSPNPSSFFIIQVNSGRIFKWEGSSANWTEIDPSVQLTNTSSPVGFGIIGGKIGIFAGPDDNVRSWDGAAAVLTDEGNANTDPPKAFLATPQSGKLIAAKTNTFGTDDLIYPCSVNDLTTWDLTSNSRRIPSPGGEGITALAMYQNDEVLVFTRRTSHSVDVSNATVTNWTRKTLQTNIGSISPWVSVVGNDAFFMSGDGHIRSIKRTEFGIAYGVSTPITYWNPNLVGRIKRNRLNKTRGVWFDNYLLVAACFDDSDTNNGLIVFDMLHQVESPSGFIPICVGEWTNINAGEFIEAYFNGREQLYYIDSNDGALYQMFSGEDDDGTTIQTQCDMKALDFGFPRNDKTAVDLELQVLDTYGDITIDYAKDSGTFSELDEETVGSAGGAVLPFTLPVTLGSGGVLDFIPKSLYGLGQSRYWQPRVSHENGLISLKQLTMRATVEEALTSGY
jgi:hypothetical protein